MNNYICLKGVRLWYKLTPPTSKVGTSPNSFETHMVVGIHSIMYVTEGKHKVKIDGKSRICTLLPKVISGACL